MGDGVRRVFDPEGEASAVLRSAVADFGDRVLSNAGLLEGVCDDRLPGLPREASLITAAARGEVAGMLAQQAGGVGPEAAVRLTAAALAEARSLDPAACLWVVAEFARCLGYPLPEGFGLDGTVPAAATPAQAVPVAPPVAAGVPTALPVGAGVPTMLPTAAPPGPWPGQPVTPVPGAPPPPAQPVARPARRMNRSLIYYGSAAAAVALYLVIAAVAALPPFGKAKPAVTAQQQLRSLIPSAYRPYCKAQKTSGVRGLTALMSCAGMPGTAGDYVNYFLFDSTANLTTGYTNLLSNAAKTTKGAGHCPTTSAGFTGFSPCETAYDFTSSSGFSGRIAEYYYKNTPDITWTVMKDKLMADSASSDGNGLVAWWNKVPPAWLSASNWTAVKG